MEFKFEHNAGGHMHCSRFKLKGVARGGVLDIKHVFAFTQQLKLLG
jgi:hypothetical protein